jgi:phosphoglycolate phosphatase
MGNFNTVVFDMDGTILDTLGDLTASVNYVLEKRGYPPRTRDEVKEIVGNGVINLLTLSLPEGIMPADFDVMLEEYLAHYKENMHKKTAPFPGILALLKTLREKGYKIAVVSNKMDKAVQSLNQHYFGEYIKVAIGESEGVKRKPAPDSVFKALAELGAFAHSAVYVGDSEVDIKTAQNAGLPSIGVTWGFRDRSVLIEAGADHIINAPEEILGILDE